MKLYRDVVRARPPRARFDLSFKHLTGVKMGFLYPLLCKEVLPGDNWNVGFAGVARAMPLVSPCLHDIDLLVELFFVPDRLCQDDFYEFMSGGEDGDSSVTLDTYTMDDGTNNVEDTIWDFLGLCPDSNADSGLDVRKAPFVACAMIYNEYYRDPNIDEAIGLAGMSGMYTIRKRRWEKDYFTSALPWQQRGTAPAFSLTGDTSAEWTYVGSTQEDGQFYYASPEYQPGNPATTSTLNNNVVDLETATAGDIADFRLSMAMMKIMELNARIGYRDVEWLRGTFGVNPRDDRLQRPEFIGALRSPVVISEVLQTSQTDTTPQGTLAGHGICADRARIGSYRAPEHGWMIGMVSIMPEAVYQQGIARQFVRTTKYDFPHPMLLGLSEQAVLRHELYADDTEANNKTVFGYQGAFNEYRKSENMVSGVMRSSHSNSLEHWHLGRDFGAAPELNGTFLECNPDPRIFADTAGVHFVLEAGWILDVTRPLTAFAIPGGVL